MNCPVLLERIRLVYPGPTYTDWMKQRVDSQEGKEVYSHRMSVVEPVFGNIGTNKGLQWMAKHWNRDVRPADGHDKNFRNQVVGTARNRVFLQPRYPIICRNTFLL